MSTLEGISIQAFVRVELLKATLAGVQHFQSKQDLQEFIDECERFVWHGEWRAAKGKAA